MASSSEIRTEPCACPDGIFCGDVCSVPCCVAGAFCCSGVWGGHPGGERVSWGVDGTGGVVCCAEALDPRHTNAVSTANGAGLIAIIFNLERENESQSVCCESSQHSFGQGTYAVGGARAGKRGLIGLGVNPGSCGAEYTPICVNAVVLSAGSGWSMA